LVFLSPPHFGVTRQFFCLYCFNSAEFDGQLIPGKIVKLKLSLPDARF